MTFLLDSVVVFVFFGAPQRVFFNAIKHEQKTTLLLCCKSHHQEDTVTKRSNQQGEKKEGFQKFKLHSLFLDGAQQTVFSGLEFD